MRERYRGFGYRATAGFDGSSCVGDPQGVRSAQPYVSFNIRDTEMGQRGRIPHHKIECARKRAPSHERAVTTCRWQLAKSRAMLRTSSQILRAARSTLSQPRSIIRSRPNRSTISLHPRGAGAWVLQYRAPKIRQRAAGFAPTALPWRSGLDSSGVCPASRTQSYIHLTNMCETPASIVTLLSTASPVLLEGPFVQK